MKIFLLTVTLSEGEHEHSDHALIEASTLEEAQKIAEKQATFDNEHSNQDEGSYFAYGEGDVDVQVDNVREITVQQAETLRELSMAYFLHRQTA
jgi:cupin superfamily acireductone dioxygenase involved in methionine salvage